MAFDKYKNGAWQEPEDSVRRYEKGAWVDCDTAKRYKNGAWEEVWSNAKRMSVYSKGYGVDYLTSQGKWGEDSYVGFDVSSTDSKTIIFSASKALSKPTTVTFDLYGYNYDADNDEELGFIRVTAYKNGSSMNSKTFYTYANTTTNCEYTYSHAECDEVRISLNGHTLDCGGTTEISIRNILIDGQKYITDPLDDF